MQRQASLQIPFRTGDFVSVQTARHTDLDAFAAEAQRGVYGLAHRPAESHALFQLQCNRLRNELSVELWLMHFLDIHKDIAVSALLQFDLQLVDLGTLAADDDSRARGLDDDAQLVARTFDLDRAHASRFELVLQLFFELHIFEEKLVVIALYEPARFPGFGVAEPKSVGMYFLTHYLSCRLGFEAVFFFAVLRGTRFFAPAGVSSPTTVAAPLPAARTRSASAISMCAMRR